MDSAIEFTYTKREAGELVSSVTSIGLGDHANLPEYTLTMDYDVLGNRTELNTPQGTLSYSYDLGSRLTGFTNHLGKSFGFDYDNLNRLQRVTRPGSYTDYFIDPTGFVTDIVHKKNSGATINEHKYFRDEIGNKTRKRTPAGDFDYAYDQNNQVTGASNPEASRESFSYDPLGNRITDNLGNFSYGAKKQRITEDYKYLYYHDNNGNLTSKSEKADMTNYQIFSYSSENQLLEIKWFKGNILQKSARYTYDALGRRVEKKIIDELDPSKDFTRMYGYDVQDLIFEEDGSGNLLATYTHSSQRVDDPLAKHITSSGVSNGLSKSSGEYYYVKDSLGTVTDLVDASGALVQHYSYSVFGKILDVINGSGVSIKDSPEVTPYITFTSREFDVESDLYFYRARYYEPSLGQFLTVDPDQGKIFNPLTFNSKYIYSLNNPINRVDPLGRISFKQILGFAAIALNPLAGLAAINTDTGRKAFDFSKRDVNRINKVAIIITAVGANVATGGSLTPVLLGVAGAGLGIAAISPEGQFLDNFLSGASAAAVSGAAFGALGTYAGQTVPVTNFRDIITILTISQDPNFQYSLESFFGQNDGDIFPGIERRHYDRL